MADGKVAGEVSPTENSNKKELLVAQVKGKVKWFNVELGYGFINRDDTNEDVFVHHTAIAKYNTRHQLSSLADGEVVEFDIVQGKKGQEAANVTGPDGEQVKGSRFASNLYAGRFRFRRGSYHGGGRRFYSRRTYRDRSTKESESDEKQYVDEKRDIADSGVKKEPIRSKKYSSNRKSLTAIGLVGGGGNGRLKRSNSLPSDLGRYAISNNFQRRRRRGPRGADGRPPFRAAPGGMKRRGPRTSEKEYNSEKGQEKKVDDTDVRRDNWNRNEKAGRGGGELKGGMKGPKSAGRREVSQEQSEKSGDPVSNEKSDSQQSHGKKRGRRPQRPRKNSGTCGEKIENSQSGPEDDRRQVKEDSGDGNQEGRPRRGSRKWRNRRGPRTDGRSSSVSVPTEGEESKSERGNGDGTKSVNEGNSVKEVASQEPVQGTA